MKTKWNLLLALMIGGGFMAAAGTADAINLESWDNQINNPGRFKVLNDFGGAAILDRETQLVWERSPDTTRRDWFQALAHCYQREVGANRLGGRSRKGWRLATIEELASLIDPTIAPPGPTLPVGHPFSNVQSSDCSVDSCYWSATTNADATVGAWLVDLLSGDVGTFGKTFIPLRAWCVRGGQGIDGVQ